MNKKINPEIVSNEYQIGKSTVRTLRPSRRVSDFADLLVIEVESRLILIPVPESGYHVSDYLPVTACP